MTVPTASSSPTPPMAKSAVLGKVWPNLGIAAAVRFSTEGLGCRPVIIGATGMPKGPRPTPNSA